MSPEHHAQRLHVLFVPAYYPSPEQPVMGLFMRDLAGVIAKLNDITVLAPASTAAPQDDLVDGIRTIRLPRPIRRGAVYTTQRFLALNATVSQLRSEGNRVDVIHAHHFSTGAIAVLEGRLRGIPVVTTENQSRTLTGELSRADVLLARFTYRGAGRVLPVSGLQERHLRSLEPSGRYEVVPDIVDIDAFTRFGTDRAGRPRRSILAVSNLISRKGLDHLVEATRMLVADGRDVALTTVGEGEERKALEAQAKGLPIKFVGRRSRAEIVELLVTADVFAMPTLSDPFAIAAVEAMAAGVPVVVTSAAGCADVIEPLGARVVPPADSAALRDALADALDGRVTNAPETTEALRGYCSPAAVGVRLDAIYQSMAEALPG
jgi:glycosyltransferase involved in cell wall biosynthesis